MTARVVVDASAVLAAVRERGDAGDRARARITDSEIHAPDHMPVEVTSVLARWRAGRVITDVDATDALEVFWTLPAYLWPLRPMRRRVWELTANVSGYDAAYVAVAEHLDATLLTADARLARAPGIRCAVELLA